MIELAQKMKIQIEDLGLKSYQEAYQLQKSAVDAVLQDEPYRLLLCEHLPIFTLGRLADEKYLLYSKEEIKRQGVDLAHIDRGGEVTLHAPGQLVIYPIIDLKNYGRDLHNYMRKLEQVAIDLLANFDIFAKRNPEQTGVWVKGQKIASIGIGVRKWVTFHGMAININTDLSLFSLIKPCGLDVEMTSMQKLLGRPINMDEVKNQFLDCFCQTFHVALAKSELFYG